MKKLAFIALFIPLFASAQTNLLLNGGFEDVNVCTEYDAECGVEGWFYLKDVKAQMLSNETNIKLLGNNSFGIFFNWLGYTEFAPLIGTILPCGLQKGKQYTFKGIISAKLNAKLILLPGICTGECFFVPKRPFAKTLIPDSISALAPVPNTNFFQFTYSFTATGTEKYLTFGTYIKEDTTGAKKKLIGTQTVSIVLDNFQLIPADGKETTCANFTLNKEKIYAYNFRHKEMDYSLFGKGDLGVFFDQQDSNSITRMQEPLPPVIRDTLKLGDVFFDFNKANLKPDATGMLANYFISEQANNNIDSIYIEGHTDSIGTDKRNMELSKQRCESVRDWLSLNNVVRNEAMHIRPFGKAKPVATNKTAEGRAMNRRVELIIFRRR